MSPAATLTPVNVICPAWANLPGLSHGTTLRRALPEAGKDDIFKAVPRARAAAAMPLAFTFGATQIHGDRIARICEPISHATRPAGFRYDEMLHIGEFAATDALVTSISGILLAIQTADCLPLFAFDAQARVAGLAHCGWRGLRADLPGKLIAAMAQCGADAARVHAWLGPCIQPDQYEVSEELIEEFEGAFPAAPVAAGHRRLDLPAIARHQLTAAGVPDAQVANSAQCTFSRPDLYHSFRGEADNSGRLLSFIGFDLPPLTD